MVSQKNMRRMKVEMWINMVQKWCCEMKYD